MVSIVNNRHGSDTVNVYDKNSKSSPASGYGTHPHRSSELQNSDVDTMAVAAGLVIYSDDFIMKNCHMYLEVEMVMQEDGAVDVVERVTTHELHAAVTVLNGEAHADLMAYSTFQSKSPRFAANRKWDMGEASKKHWWHERTRSC